MKKNKNSVDLRRHSISPKGAFPPLTAHCQIRSDKANPMLPLSVYSTSTDQNQTNYSKFFTLKPYALSNSPHTDISTCRTVITSQEVSHSNHLYNSEIIERIESYELRYKKGASLDSYLSNYSMLEKYFQETLSSLEDNKSSFKNGLVLFCKHFSDLAKQALKLFKSSFKESHDKYEKISLEFTKLENENKHLKYELEKIKEYKKFELEKIEKEIEEIFGKNDLEILALRQSLNSQLGSCNQDTVELLLHIWNSMNQDYEIPDIKNSDFLGTDPSEIPDIMSKKFSIVHRFTVKRIFDLLNMKKTSKDKESQTYIEYIPPALYNEQVKQVEKLQIQLSAALMSVEKYRENFGSKVNTLDTLEAEKKDLKEELQKQKKEAEVLRNAIEKSHYELTHIKSELDSVKREKESLVNEKFSLHSQVAEKEKAIQEAKILAEKNERNLKEKEDKIQNLEKNLSKRKKKKKESPVEEPTSAKLKKSKFDEKEFMKSLGSKNKRTDKSDSPSLSSNPLSSGLSQDSGFNGTDLSRLSTQGGQNTSVSSSKPSSKGSEKSNKKRGLNIKLNQIDEISSPNKSNRNIDKYSDYSQKKDKTKGTGMIYNDSDEEYQKRHRKSRQGSRENDESQDSYEDSDDNFNRSNNGTALYVKRPKNSRHSQVSEYSRGSRGSDFYEKRTAANSKMTSMDDLIWENCIKYSKGIQMNGMGVPDEDSEEHSGVHMFPFNPNQFYALRGDKYYHTSKCVFSAQPRIPEMKNSIVFTSPYHLEPKDQFDIN